MGKAYLALCSCYWHFALGALLVGGRAEGAGGCVSKVPRAKYQ